MLNSAKSTLTHCRHCVETLIPPQYVQLSRFIPVYEVPLIRYVRQIQKTPLNMKFGAHCRAQINTSRSTLYYFIPVVCIYKRVGCLFHHRTVKTSGVNFLCIILLLFIRYIH